MKKRYSIHLAFLLTALLALTACSEKETVDQSKEKPSKGSQQEVVQTFLMYSETSETDDLGSVGDLYVKTLSSDSDKIAGDVLNDRYKYIQSNDTVLFLTSDYDLYEYKKGSDKEKIASDVASFEGGYANNIIFYQNDDGDLYIVNGKRETEKIASSVSSMDMINSDLYYANTDGNLQVYNIESRKETSLGSNINYFQLLNTDGDFIYTNDDSMLFYQEKDQEPIKISGKEVYSSFIEQVDQGFVYMASEDDEQALYQTSIDGTETIKIASDVETYEIKGDNVVYLTYDDNLFMKSVGDTAALKLASEVSYFSVADDVVFYVDTEDTAYVVTDKAEKTKKATNVDSMSITSANKLLYENDNSELFLEDTKLSMDVDDYALFANNVAYATDDDKLYFMPELEEAVVVEDDLSKYSVVTYQNNTIFTNYLTFADISGDWEMSMDGETGIAHITAKGILSNDLYETTIQLEELYAGHNYMEVSYDDEYGRFELDGSTLTLSDGEDQIYFEKMTKKAVAEANKESEEIAKKPAEQTTEKPAEQQVTEQKAPETVVTLDTVPVPGARNTVESTRDQISYTVYSYLEAYANGDTTSLADSVHSSSAFYSEQRSYMENLNSRGVNIDILNQSISSIQSIGTNKYKVTVQEQYGIDDPEKGYSEPTQTSYYTIELVDGFFYITAFSF